MWECEWREYKKLHSTNNKYIYPTEHKFRMSETEILKHIQNGEIFGAIEVDIHVPDHLKTYFEEMPPIFKNTTVTHNDIGEYMQTFLQEKGEKFPDRRYLIGSMFGRKILLTTPLLKWYLSHGLVVTKVYQVIEFNPKKCFSKFADNISDDRRAGNKCDIL